MAIFSHLSNIAVLVQQTRSSNQLSVISYQLSDLSFKWVVLNRSFLLSFHCLLFIVHCSLKLPTYLLVLNINIYSRGKWDKCHPSIMNVDRETLCKYVYIYYFTDLNVAKLRRHFADIPFISFSYPQTFLIFIIHFHMIKRISGPSSYFCHEMSSWTP